MSHDLTETSIEAQSNNAGRLTFQISCLLKSLRKSGWRKSAIKGEAQSFLPGRFHHDELAMKTANSRRPYHDYANSGRQIESIRLSKTVLIKQGSHVSTVSPIENQIRRADRIFFSSCSILHEPPSLCCTSRSLPSPKLFVSPYLRCAISKYPLQNFSSSPPKSNQFIHSTESDVFNLRIHKKLNLGSSNPSLKIRANLENSISKLPTLFGTQNQAASVRNGDARPSRPENIRFQQNLSEDDTKNFPFPNSVDYKTSACKDLLLSLLSVSWSSPNDGPGTNSFCKLTASSAKQVLNLRIVSCSRHSPSLLFHRPLLT